MLLKKIKNTVLWTYVISDLSSEEVAETFHEKELQKEPQEEFRVERTVKGKGNKLYVKYKAYDSSFNSCIDKKDIV